MSPGRVGGSTAGPRHKGARRLSDQKRLRDITPRRDEIGLSGSDRDASHQKGTSSREAKWLMWLMWLPRLRLGSTGGPFAVSRARQGSGVAARGLSASGSLQASATASGERRAVEVMECHRVHHRRGDL